MRSTVSIGDNPRGTSSVKNNPVISPCVLLTSDATMTGNGAILATACPPRMVLWSVTAMHPMPMRSARATSASGDVAQSRE